jgi:hypothetical protein
MTVNVTKPALNIREKLAELDKPSGIAGEAMLRADSVQEQRNLIGAGRKNLIINGGMQVSQRKDVDSSAISTSINTYDIDRFLSSIVGVSATSQRLLDQAVNGKVVNTFKQVATSSATGRLGQIQKFELLPKGETVTLSVWVRSNTSNAHLFHYDNTAVIASSPHTGGGNWEKLTITTTLDVDKASIEALLRVSTSTNSNIAITSGDYIESAMWQLELGSVATDFEHRSYGEELALCQRYYEVIEYAQATFTPDGSNTGILIGAVPFKVTKRAVPTCGSFTLQHVNSGTSYTGRLLDGITTSSAGSVLYTTVSQFNSTYLYRNLTSISIDAEL